MQSPLPNPTSTLPGGLGQSRTQVSFRKPLPTRKWPDACQGSFWLQGCQGPKKHQGNQYSPSPLYWAPEHPAQGADGRKNAHRCPTIPGPQLPGNKIQEAPRWASWVTLERVWVAEGTQLGINHLTSLTVYFLKTISESCENIT